MKEAATIEPLRASAARQLHRLWNIEALEERLLLSGADVFGVRKVKFVEADGDKVKLSISGKDNMDVVFDRDLANHIVGIDTITLHGTDASSQLNFSLKPAKGGGSDLTTFVGSILSGNASQSLRGINATGAALSSVDLTGSLTGNLTTNRDLGDVTVAGTLNSVVIQNARDLTGDLTAANIGKVTATGGDLLGSITATNGITSVQARNMAGNLTAGTTLGRLTLSGDLSGDVAFGRDTLELLISGSVTSSASITGNAGSGVANINAGSFARLGVIGNFAGTIMTDGSVGLGVGGALLDTATVRAGTDNDVAGNLEVKALSIAADLAASGNVSFAMTNGGFSGTITAGQDVFGNGVNSGIVIRGGDFTGAIFAGLNPNNNMVQPGGDVAAMTFLPTAAGFNGTIVASGTANAITAGFFGSNTSISAATIGDLFANRSIAGDAIAAGALFTATTGSIGTVTAKAVSGVGIAGTFVAAQNIGNINATSTGIGSGHHAISEASFTATAGTIGTIVAGAKAGSGINDSSFTAETGIGNIAGSSQTGHGFRASMDGANIFAVLDGSLGDISGVSILGDGIHGSTFTASENIGNVNGSSASGSGIGDPTGAVGTFFNAGGSISSLKGTATGGGAGAGGDGMVHVTAAAGENEGGLGFGSIQGSSQFGSGIVGSRFSAQGSIALIVGTTNNTNPTVDEDGINTTVFRTASDIQEVTATTGVTGGAGVGSAIEESLFSAAGNIATPEEPVMAPTQVKAPGPLVDSIRIDNDIPLGTLGHWDVDVNTGGESNSAQLTASRLASGDIVTEDVLFDYYSYVDTGNNGGGFQLSSGADPTQVGSDPDKVQSTGSFTGANGNTINYTVTSSIANGDSVMYSTFTFTAQSGTLGVFRFMQYLDEDIEGVSDDVLYVTGSAANNDLQLFTFDNDEVYGVSHSGSLSTAQGLVNAAFAGWAADEYNDMKPQITGSGQSVSLGGVIDLTDLPAFTHPTLGAVNGPADIVSVLAWDVDPNATTATIITTLGGVPTPPTPEPPPIPTGDCEGHGSDLPIVISVTGDIRDSQFLAGYDIGADMSFDGTSNDASEFAALQPSVLGSIRVTGDWINSFAASGISSADGQLGNGDDTLSAPGSAIGNILLTSNIAGDVNNPGSPPLRNFQSDSIGTLAANAIGIDPNSGSAAATIGVFTNFANGTVGSIGDIIAETRTQAQAIGDGSEFHAGTSIACISAVNTNTSLNLLNAIGSATFEAGTSIGNITAQVDNGPFAAAIQFASFIAHDNAADTELAIGNIEASNDFSDLAAIDGVLFDASSPTVVGTPLHIGTIRTDGDISDSSFLATGNIANGTIFEGEICVTTTSPGPLQITETTDENALVNRLFGGMIPAGITIDDITLVAPGDPDIAGSSSVGLYEGFPSLPLGSIAQLPDGILLTSGLARNALGPNNTGSETTDLDAAGDSDLDGLDPGDDTTDASSLSITFTTDGSVASFSALFVFASEEFAEFVNSPFNDIFAVFLDGVNISNDPNGNILNVNNNFFLLNNTDENPPTDFNGDDITGTTLVDITDIQYDGLTPVLRVSTPGTLTPGQHTLKFAVADVSDHLWDSGVFISALCPSSEPGGGGTNLPMPSQIGIEVEGDIGNSQFIADFDNNGTGSIAAIGGIHVLVREGMAGSMTGGGHMGILFRDGDVFSAGGNDPVSGLAIGNIQVDGSDIFDAAGNPILWAVDGATFVADTIPDLNIGTITTTAGSIGTTKSYISSFTATGDIRDLNIASGITTGSTFLADSDADNAGDIFDITAGGIVNATVSGNNVAVSGGITVVSSIDMFTVTATTGDIGDLNVSQDEDNSSGIGVHNSTFSAAVNIGNIAIKYTKPPAPQEDPDSMFTPLGSTLSDTQFLAAQVDPTGKIGTVTVENIIAENDSEQMNGNTFYAGTGGIGDILILSVGQGEGMIATSFRTTGANDDDQHGDIGNITVATGSEDAVVDSIISSIGNIGDGEGNENGFNIELSGGVLGSIFAAGYDIGADLMIGTADDLLASVITSINKIMIEGRFIQSNLVAGVNPVDGIFGNSNDTPAVVGSSLGIVSLGGVVDPEEEPGMGGLIAESPLMDRNYLIGADLIGDFLVGGETQFSALPGYLDNEGTLNTVDDVNVRVL
jgi:hypothetical protein